MTNTAVKILVPVTFARMTRHEVTLAAGSVVAWRPSLGYDNEIIVSFAGKNAAMSMDDALPVVWDDAEQMWDEE